MVFDEKEEDNSSPLHGQRVVICFMEASCDVSLALGESSNISIGSSGRRSKTKTGASGNYCRFRESAEMSMFLSTLGTQLDSVSLAGLKSLYG